MFCELGFAALVRRARDGARRADLARCIPSELLGRVCALGSRESLIARLDAYYEAGADTVAVVPSTAEDPRGRSALGAISEGFRRPHSATASGGTQAYDDI
jgi:alkanesulfonate monooxygenase SsuD/methylene tetrahydromethanopterin reductase-like flavin-dependent oxidoreductase (luciferase family)